MDQPISHVPNVASGEVGSPKTSPIIIILLILVFLASTGAAAFLYIQNMSLKSQLAQLTVTPTPEITSAPVVSPIASPSAQPSTTGYSCPVSGYVDCMPILDAEGQKRCAPEAMTWYKANCPNFQGGAL